MVQECWSEAFELAWWPLDIAVSWILTRDRIFVERQWRRSGNDFLGIEVSLAADQHSGRRVALAFEGVDQAWTALKRRLEAGEIKVVGTPFQRIADVSGNASETSDPQREISDSEIGSLMVDRDGDDLCLIPEDWRVARGSNYNSLRGYRNVQVRTNGVCHYFPPSTDLPLSSETLGELPRNPKLPGWMPLTDAAFWIASKGGTEVFNLRDINVWKMAFGQLVPRISSGDANVIGRHEGKGLPIPIPGSTFSGIAVDYPYTESPDDFFSMLTSERPFVRCYAVVDDESWEKGLSDSLIADKPYAPAFTHLQISNRDVLAHWSFDVAPTPRLPTNERKGKVYTQGKRDRATKAILALYPEGVPEVSVLDNATLCKNVGKWLKDEKLADVSDDTILRAAGRRRK